uniref:Toxin 23 isoform a n=1 Tax=Cupiennius salei TaxID=6928 RepID=A0A4Y5UGK4_CUPSA|nr:toxin 23 isoform a precursor [Cupiennius salei]
MKFLLFTGLVFIVLASLIEAEAESERACIEYELECTENKDNCCSDYKCQCYRRFVKGVDKGPSCFCLEKDVKYKPL